MLRSRTMSNSHLRARSRSHSIARSRSHSIARSRSYSRTRSCSRRNFATTYELADRHSNDVNIYWQWSIIFVMIITAILSFVSIHSFKSLMWSYNNRCIINSALIIRGRIDERQSSYGSHTLCDYMLFSPLLVTVFAMFWIEMFYLYGRGGYILNKELQFADEPWRMVIPALVSFGIATLYEVCHVIILHNYLRLFCRQLRDNYPDKDKNCAYLVAFYSFKPELSIYPNHLNYSILFHSTLWTMMTCLLATLIMVLRVLRAADFEVVAIKKRIKRISFSQRLPRVSVMSTSKEKLIYIDRNFVSSRSVHFK